MLIQKNSISQQKKIRLTYVNANTASYLISATQESKQKVERRNGQDLYLSSEIENRKSILKDFFYSRRGMIFLTELIIEKLNKTLFALNNLFYIKLKVYVYTRL